MGKQNPIRQGLVVAVILLLLLCMNIFPTTGKMIFDDTTPPVTTHEFIGTMGYEDWFVSDVIIILTATDDISGVNITYYKLHNENEWNEYTDVITVDDDGYYELFYYSIDNVGNVEDVHGPYELKIDQTSPAALIYIFSLGEQEYRFEVVVEDDMSGSDKVEFYIAYELMYIDYDEPFEWIYNGSDVTLYQIYPVDIAGNYGYGQEAQKERFTGIICNKKITDEHISFFVVLGRTNDHWIIFDHFSIPIYSEGHVGRFFIRAGWYI